MLNTPMSFLDSAAPPPPPPPAPSSSSGRTALGTARLALPIGKLPKPAAAATALSSPDKPAAASALPRLPAPRKPAATTAVSTPRPGPAATATTIGKPAAVSPRPAKPAAAAARRVRGSAEPLKTTVHVRPPNAPRGQSDPRTDAQILAELRAALRTHRANRGNVDGVAWRCAVALVLRQRPADGVLQVAYIKRALNPRDRWSGTVAFPGGRQQGAEPLLETARREALEECGFCLADAAQYEYLGELDSHTVVWKGMHGGHTMNVACHVFLQCDPAAAPPPRLDANEVQALRWVSLRALAETAPRGHVTLSAEFLFLTSPLRFLWLFLRYLVGRETIDFPAIVLPPEPHEPTADMEFALWGLSLSITEDLLGLARLATSGRSAQVLQRLGNGTGVVTKASTERARL